MREYYQKGNEQLLNKTKIGILASRGSKPRITRQVIQTIRRMNQIERVLIGGWHAPAEKEIHQYLVRQQVPHIHVEAKGLPATNCKLSGGHVLFITHCSDEVKRITRTNAVKRNELVCQLSEALLIPWVTPGGKTSELVQQHCKEKSVIVFDVDSNRALIEEGALPVQEYSRG